MSWNVSGEKITLQNIVESLTKPEDDKVQKKLEKKKIYF